MRKAFLSNTATNAPVSAPLAGTKTAAAKTAAGNANAAAATTATKPRASRALSRRLLAAAAGMTAIAGLTAAALAPSAPSAYAANVINPPAINYFFGNDSDKSAFENYTGGDLTQYNSFPNPLKETYKADTDFSAADGDSIVIGSASSDTEISFFVNSSNASFDGSVAPTGKISELAFGDTVANVNFYGITGSQKDQLKLINADINFGTSLPYTTVEIYLENIAVTTTQNIYAADITLSGNKDGSSLTLDATTTTEAFLYIGKAATLDNATLVFKGAKANIAGNNIKNEPAYNYSNPAKSITLKNTSAIVFDSVGGSYNFGNDSAYGSPELTTLYGTEIHLGDLSNDADITFTASTSDDRVTIASHVLADSNATFENTALTLTGDGGFVFPNTVRLGSLTIAAGTAAENNIPTFTGYVQVRNLTITADTLFPGTTITADKTKVTGNATVTLEDTVLRIGTEAILDNATLILNGTTANFAGENNTSATPQISTQSDGKKYIALTGKSEIVFENVGSSYVLGNGAGDGGASLVGSAGGTEITLGDQNVNNSDDADITLTAKNDTDAVTINSFISTDDTTTTALTLGGAGTFTFNNTVGQTNSVGTLTTEATGTAGTIFNGYVNAGDININALTTFNDTVKATGTITIPANTIALFNAPVFAGELDTKSQLTFTHNITAGTAIVTDTSITLDGSAAAVRYFIGAAAVLNNSTLLITGDANIAGDNSGNFSSTPNPEKSITLTGTSAITFNNVGSGYQFGNAATIGTAPATTLAGTKITLAANSESADITLTVTNASDDVTIAASIITATGATASNLSLAGAGSFTFDNTVSVAGNLTIPASISAVSFGGEVKATDTLSINAPATFTSDKVTADALSINANSSFTGTTITGDSIEITGVSPQTLVNVSLDNSTLKIGTSLTLNNAHISLTNDSNFAGDNSVNSDTKKSITILNSVNIDFPENAGTYYLGDASLNGTEIHLGSTDTAASVTLNTGSIDTDKFIIASHVLAKATGTTSTADTSLSVTGSGAIEFQNTVNVGSININVANDATFGGYVIADSFSYDDQAAGTATGNLTFNSDVTVTDFAVTSAKDVFFNDDVTVSGDFNVTGNLTIADTASLEITSTNTVSVTGNLTAAGTVTTAGDFNIITGGLTIENTGSLDTAGDLTVADTITADGALTAANITVTTGDFSATAAVTTANVTVSNGDFSLSGTGTDIAGDILVSTGNLETAANVPLNSANITVTAGTATFNADLELAGNLTAGSDITLNADATIAGNLTVNSGDLALAGVSKVTGDITVATGNLVAAGTAPVQAGNNIFIAGTAEFGNQVEAIDIEIGSTAKFDGNVAATNITTGDDTTFAQKLDLTGNLTTATGIVTFNGISKVTGDIEVTTGSLLANVGAPLTAASITVGDVAAFQDTVTTTAGDLNVTNEITFNAETIIAGDIITGKITASSYSEIYAVNIDITSGEFGGTVELTGNLNATYGDVVFNDDVNIAGDLRVIGDLTTAAGADIVAANVHVAGKTVLDGNVTTASANASDIQNYAGDLVLKAADVTLTTSQLYINNLIGLGNTLHVVGVQQGYLNIANITGDATLDITFGGNATVNNDLFSRLSFVNDATNPAASFEVKSTGTITFNVEDHGTVYTTGNQNYLASDDGKSETTGNIFLERDTTLVVSAAGGSINFNGATINGNNHALTLSQIGAFTVSDDTVSFANLSALNFTNSAIFNSALNAPITDLTVGDTEHRGSNLTATAALKAKTITVWNNLSATTASASITTENLEVGGNLEAHGAVNVTGTIAVAGDAHSLSTLDAAYLYVAGNATLDGSTKITGDILVGTTSAGNLTAGSTFTATGNVTVSGNASFISTSAAVNIAGNLTVGYNSTGTTGDISKTTTFANGGSVTGFIKTAGNLVVGDSKSLTAGALDIAGNLIATGASVTTATGNATIAGFAYAAALNIAGDLSVAEDTDVSGDLLVAGNAAFTGNTNVAGNLTVNADASFAATANVAGTTRVAGTLTANANFTGSDVYVGANLITATDTTFAADNVEVAGNFIAAGAVSATDISVTGNLITAAALNAADISVTGDFTAAVGFDATAVAVTGNLTTTGNFNTASLTVAGSALFNNSATTGTDEEDADAAAAPDVAAVTGNLSITGDLTSHAALTVGNNATISGKAEFYETVNVAGNLTVIGTGTGSIDAEATKALSAGTLNVGDASHVSNFAAHDIVNITAGDASITGNATFSSAATVAGALNVGETLYAASTLFANNVSVGGDATFVVKATIENTLTVGGDVITERDDIEVGGNATIAGDAYFAYAATIGGDLTVGGGLSAFGVFNAANVSVTGSAAFGTTATITGTLNVGNAANEETATLTTAGVLTATAINVTGNAELGGPVALTGALTVTGDLVTGATLNAASIAVTGSTTLGENVTTTGSQNYAGGLLLNGNITITATDTGSAISFGSAGAGSANGGSFTLTVAQPDATEVTDATFHDLGALSITYDATLRSLASTVKALNVGGILTIPAGTSFTQAAPISAGAVRNAGTLTLDRAFATTGGDFDNTDGTLTLAGDLNAGNFNNTRGTVNFRNAGYTITANGNLIAGNGADAGSYVLDINLGDPEECDKIVAYGNITGSHHLILRDATSGIEYRKADRKFLQEKGAAITVVSAPYNSAGDETITGELTYGLRTLPLTPNSDKTAWTLSTVNGGLPASYSPLAGALLNVASAVSDGFFSQLDSLRTRLGDIRDLADPTAGKSAHTMFWVRGYANRTSTNLGISGVSNFTEYQYGADVGVDRVNRWLSGTLAIGAFVGYQTGHRSLSCGASDAEGVAAGVYASFARKDGLYFDGVIKGQRGGTDYDVFSGGVSEHAEFDSALLGASIELGKRWTSAHSFVGSFLEVAAHVDYAHRYAETYDTEGRLQTTSGPVEGFHINTSDSDHLRAAATARIGRDYEYGEFGTVTPYILGAAGYRHSWGGAVRVGDLRERPNTDGAFGSLGLGLSWRPSTSISFHFDYAATLSEKTYSPWSINAGLRWHF